MTQFVVSLFLPYTIDFKHKHSDPDLEKATSPRNSDLPVGQASPAFNRPSSPSAPAKAQKEDDNTKEPLFPTLATSSPSLHFTQPQDPRALARTDSHPPEWGRAHVFNQPHWPIKVLPPYTVLQSPVAQPKFVSEVHTHDTTSQTPITTFKSHSWRVVPAVRGNGGLKNAVQAAADEGLLTDRCCVGTLGFPTDALEQSTKHEIRQTLAVEFESCPVFVGDQDFHGHYNNYCKSILWPILHYQVPDQPKSKAYEDHSWEFYSRINEHFADKIIQNYKHGDTIWIHDYHLMLVPGIIRKRIPHASIGFFLHVSFPSSEIFRCLAQRKQLLKGMLGANLVAFQSHEYVHHFLQTCSHLLVIEATQRGVQLEDRFVDVACNPMGIIPDQIMMARESPEVLEWKQKIEQKYKDKRILVSRAKLEGTRGIKQTLLAYELFLRQHAEWRDNVVLIQIATPTSKGRDDMESDIAEIIHRIDERYSTLDYQPVHFLKQEIKFSQYLALLSSADVFLVMALRDGLNLTCHEYVLCQDGKAIEATKKFGSLILSEFTGSAAMFAGAEIAVNPWDIQQCAEAIHQALTNCEKESQRKIRFQGMLNAVLQHNGVTWVARLNSMLSISYNSQMERNIMSTPRLSFPQLHEQYKLANSRLFVLDFEGTLGFWDTPTESDFAIPKREISVLHKLMSEANVVYVMSSRTPDELDQYFREIPGIGLIAENGCFLRPFSKDGVFMEWMDLVGSAKSETWKDDARKVLDYYCERIERSWIEERNCSLILHYENVQEKQNIESARKQAGDCANHLNHVCHTSPVKAVPVHKSVIVELKDHNKSTGCVKVLELERHRISRHQHDLKFAHNEDSHAMAEDFPEFLMVAGDDREDEVVFGWANSLEREGIVAEAITVCVGNRSATDAKHTLTHGITELLSTLEELCKP